jgi:hypothetical protein
MSRPGITPAEEHHSAGGQHGERGGDRGPPQAGVPPGWLALAAATVGGAEEAGVSAARGVVVCHAQAVAVDEEGRTGTGVSGVHTGVAAPTISASPTPPVGGLNLDQLLLSQMLPDWST